MPEILDDKDAFAGRLASLASEAGLEAAACLRLDSRKYLESLQAFKGAYSAARLASMPEYVGRGASVKADPSSLAPWARSAIVALGAFSKLPEAPNAGLFRRAGESSPLSGLVAGYALRADYHRWALTAMSRMKEDLERIAGVPLRVQFFADSNPLPERGLAVLSGLGSIGRSRCLLKDGLGAGIFIASLWTDFSFPECVKEGLVQGCASCHACAEACPNSVLGGDIFECRQCVAALSSEFRGAFSIEEARLMGDWIFGCGRCVSACPGSRMPPPVAVDLEWLLMCGSSELEKAISGTPMERAGTTLLRRNALAALFNKGSMEAQELLRRFQGRSGSAMLSSFAGELLNRL